MARNYSDKRVKDIEFASEAIIDSCILVENTRCKRILNVNNGVTEQFKSDQQIDPSFEKRNY